MRAASPGARHPPSTRSHSHRTAAVIHPDTELRQRGGDVGLGVVATRPIPRGTILWTLDRFDRVLDPSVVRHWPEAIRGVVERYAYVDGDGRLVFCWDDGRRMNHACDPASIGVGQTFEVARRDLQPGEELTCDYATLNMSTALACACGGPTCRGLVTPTLAPEWVARWDQWATEAWAAAFHVPQPLLAFAAPRPGDEALVRALEMGLPAPSPSIRRNLRVGASVEVDTGRPWKVA